MIKFNFKKEYGAKPQNLHLRLIPDFTKDIKEIGEFNFTLLNADVSELDLSDMGDAVKVLNFDNNTVFPPTDKLPKWFDPKKILEDGKNPGLGIAALHKQGITGLGITVAIIDEVLDTQHQEIKDNLVHYENIGWPENTPAQMHATAVSSLLCGKTVGVAPKTKLVFFAANLKDGKPGEKTYVSNSNGKPINIYLSNYAKALKKILFMNARLPKDERISAVSISSGMLWHDIECTNLIKQLIDSGVMVLTCDAENFYGEKARFTRIHRLINSDPDSPESYVYDRNRALVNSTDILVPSGGRTMAGFCGHDNYIYSGVGGLSWSTPYLVGVYALAKQIMPNLTAQHFFDVVRQTGFSDTKFGNNIVIQPQKIIEYLQNEKILQQQNIEAKSM